MNKTNIEPELSAYLSIDCFAIEHNLDTLRKKTKSRIMAVVKNNGYGLSLLEYAGLLGELGVDCFAAGSCEEAVALRDGGITAPLLLLTPQLSIQTVRELIMRDVMLTVGSVPQAETVRKAARELGAQPKIHIKVDTGLGRYGFMPDDLMHVAPAVRDMDVRGIYTHFASPYADTKMTHRQYEAFLEAAQQLKSTGVKAEVLHCSASGGMLNYPHMHMDMVRLGSALLGRVPNGRAHGLMQAVCLKAPVLAVKPAGAARRIGYGQRVAAGFGRRVGVLPVGHAYGVVMQKGILGLWAKRQYAIINNKRARVLGPLGIGAIAVDLTGVRCVEGDEAKLDVNPLHCAAGIRRIFANATIAERKAEGAQPCTQRATAASTSRLRAHTVANSNNGRGQGREPTSMVTDGMPRSSIAQSL